MYRSNMQVCPFEHTLSLFSNLLHQNCLATSLFQVEMYVKKKQETLSKFKQTTKIDVK